VYKRFLAKMLDAIPEEILLAIIEQVGESIFLAPKTCLTGGRFPERETLKGCAQCPEKYMT
jgi:hypothetical protein